MRRTLALIAGVAVAVVGLSSAGGAAPGSAAVDHVPVCPGPAEPGAARCHAQLPVGPGRTAPQVSSSPYGLSPSQIQSAYGWTSIGDGAGRTIAIVDAYDDPTAEADLNTFSQQYGLPRTCAATGNVQPCFVFTKV